MASTNQRSNRREEYSRLYDSTVCAFCGMNEDDELLYGKFYVSDSITVHSNCMFFASGLSQEGKETQGINGFLMPHIEAELRRGKKLLCVYCKKRGATVGCCEIKCKKSFHLNCGIKNGSLHQFFNSFCSYCKIHRPKQNDVVVTEDLYCYLCCEEISPNDLQSCLYSPCCKKNWSHRLCLQKYALSAGSYFFKCPFCNNNKEFVKEMKTFGINVPDKDASWELEDNAYQELLLKPQCGASVCECSKGRDYCGPSRSGWSLLSCSYCGSHARHKRCGNMKLTVKSWICQECKNLENEMRKSKISTRSMNKCIAKNKNDLRSETISSSSALCTLSSPLTTNDDLGNKTVTSSSAYSLLFSPSKIDDLGNETVTSSALCTLSSPPSKIDDLRNETVTSSALCTLSSPPSKIDDFSCETPSSSVLCTSSPNINNELGSETLSSPSALFSLSASENENDNLVSNTDSSALCSLSASLMKDLHCIRKGNMKYLTVVNSFDTESSSLDFLKSNDFESVADVRESNTLIADTEMIEMDMSDALVPSENPDKIFLSPKPITMKPGSIKLSQPKKKNSKNIANNPVKKKPDILKPRTVHKVSKKARKVTTCCSDPNHTCIKKYFGQKCVKYRLL